MLETRQPLPEKMSTKEKKDTLKNYARKVGATIQRFHHITDNDNDYLFAEVDLDGGEQVDWHYPLLKGKKGVEVDENAPF